MVNFRVALLSTVIFLAGCSGPVLVDVTPDTPPERIQALAQAEANAGKLTRAADYYIELERFYPYTPQAQSALISAARLYHNDEAYGESRAAAQRYLTFFPGGPDAAEAQYLVGLSYFDDLGDIKRDQSRTFEALQAFQNVVDNYPSSQYAPLAAQKFDNALYQLAGKELDIGRYYLLQDHFTAAIGRFKAVINEYPETPSRPEAMHRLVEAYLGLGLRDEASIVANELQTAYPNSTWAQASQSLLTTGRQPDGGVSTLRRVILGDWFN